MHRILSFSPLFSPFLSFSLPLYPLLNPSVSIFLSLPPSLWSLPISITLMEVNFFHINSSMKFGFKRTTTRKPQANLFQYVHTKHNFSHLTDEIACLTILQPNIFHKTHNTHSSSYITIKTKQYLKYFITVSYWTWQKCFQEV